MALTDGFVDLKALMPNLCVELAYASSANFTGAVVDGYQANRALLTEQAATALQRVQQALNAQGLGLKIYDAYRPQRAIPCFLAWASNDDESTKSTYFPNHEKSQLFDLGYLGLHSAHCRGSTVDLTVIEQDSGRELDMGTAFDFFDQASWTSYQALSSTQLANRTLLAEQMQQQGFVGFEMEWWHFTLADEPFLNRSFDFPVC
ncbi:M15 family metallopeptidase [Oceanobacter kriegii]|uniref:M15 family metallopeptidase n=1 Tax=Oceanobacter kriegii TaxID=64972 RepID=UPI0004239020|nr:M15 family metallopeptidase [Oceanobacter kriegii]